MCDFTHHLCSQNHTPVEGWLDIRKDKSEQWERSWVCFEEKLGLRFSSKKESVPSIFYEVRLNDVISFRQDVGIHH